MSLEPYEEIRQCLTDYKALSKEIAESLDLAPLKPDQFNKLQDMITMRNDRRILLKSYLLALKADSNTDAYELFQHVVEAL